MKKKQFVIAAAVVIAVSIAIAYYASNATQLAVSYAPINAPTKTSCYSNYLKETIYSCASDNECLAYFVSANAQYSLYGVTAREVVECRSGKCFMRDIVCPPARIIK